MKEFSAGPDEAGRRLDVVVAELYPGLTRSSLEPLFARGFVSVGNRPAKASHKLHEGEKIEIDETYLKQKPPKIDLPILYEDDDVIVIDKPPGILAHSKGALHFEATVASFIKPKLKDKSLEGNRAGIVHRLDRWTSGVIVTAKTAEAQRFLQKQFSQRRVKKKYIGMVEGVPEPYAAFIDAPIGRNPKKPQTFHVSADGKPAQTQYEVLDTYSVKHKSYAMLVLKPETGRTHQLRVHLAYIGHPIVGDIVYGSGSGGLMLHAAELELTLPNKERRVFKSKLPDSFKRFAKND